MRAVRDRADARWAPSRFNFAVFRLAALIVGSRADVEHRHGAVLVIERNQNSVESYVVSAWVVASLSVFTQSLLARPIGWIAATVISVPLVLALLQVIPIAGFIVLPTPARDQTRLNGAVLMTAFAALSGWIASTNLWSRYVGMLFLVILIINAVAAALLSLLKPKIVAVDRARGVPE